MEKKILFVDLEGTLLNDNGEVPEINKRAVRELLDAGHYVAISTGREVFNARIFVKKMGISSTGCYIIAYNGAVIYDCSGDCILEERRLPIGCTEYLTSEAIKADIHIQAYAERYVLAMKYTKELDFYIKRTHMPYRIEPNVWMIDESPKMLLIDLDGGKKLRKFRKDHLEWEKGKCTSFFSGKEYLEYCPLGITKGYGVTYLEEMLNVQKKDTFAVGDQENDIPMLKTAGMGCAMKNSAKQVKQSADYITQMDNDEGGVAEVIYRFILK